MAKLTAKQELFAQAYIERTGDKVQAYKDAGYSLELNAASMSVQADKLYNIPKINLRIEELQAKADKIANESFSISVKQRLEWLKEITMAGLGDYIDQHGNKRRENLAASRSAIDTMNAMLGVNDDSSETAQPLSITFSVNQAVNEVKVINAKS